MAINRKVRGYDDFKSFKKSSLLVLCADEPTDIMTWTNEFCIKNRQPFINVGYMNDIPVVGPLYVSDITGCFYCQKVAPNKLEEKTKIEQVINTINSRYEVPSFSTTNHISYSIAFQEIIKFLANRQDLLCINQRVGINIHTLEVLKQNMSYSKDCLVCNQAK